MTTFHRYLGTLLLLLFTVMLVTALVLRVTGRRETPTAVWALQHWTENLLIVQTVLGLVMLVLGRRVPGPSLAWFHYLYGSLFPIIALLGGRLAALRRETREYVGLAWGAFVALGLTLRAAQTGCIGFDLVSCLMR